MNKFISFDRTPADEKQLGVATAVFNGKMLLRYKVMKNKDGIGFYIVPPSLKINDNFADGFTIDSRIENEEFMNMIRSCVKRELAIPENPASTSDVPF